MDLIDEDEDRAFRLRARDWLQANAPTASLPPQYTEEGLAAHRDWERQLLAAGYAALHWPVEYGGIGAARHRLAIFQEEYVRTRAPRRLNRIALGLIGPTIMAFGTEEQKQLHLPAMLDCSGIWCQGFSEPESGSDLASLRSRAVADGGAFVLDGRKVWSSLAVFSQWMFGLFRTDSAQTGYRGITAFLVPLDTPGIQVTPIRQVDGYPGFAEIQFDEVRLPASAVLGEVGGGWTVAMAALVHERASGVGTYAQFCLDVEHLIALARARGGAQDRVVRARVAQLYADAEAFRAHMQRIASIDDDHRVGALANVTKLYWSQMEVRIFETAADLLGPDAELLQAADAQLMGDFHYRYWQSRAAQIFAGTNEIQRTSIATRLLGLPREATRVR